MTFPLCEQNIIASRSKAIKNLNFTSKIKLLWWRLKMTYFVSKQGITLCKISLNLPSWIVFHPWEPLTSYHFLKFYVISHLHVVCSVDFEVWSKLSICTRIKEYCIKICGRFWLRLAACKHVFPLRYSGTHSTSANYLLHVLWYKSDGYCCDGM